MKQDKSLEIDSSLTQETSASHAGVQDPAGEKETSRGLDSAEEMPPLQGSEIPGDTGADGNCASQLSSDPSDADGILLDPVAEKKHRQKVVLLIGVLLVAAVVLLWLSFPRFKGNGSQNTSSVPFAVADDQAIQNLESPIPDNNTSSETVTASEIVVSPEESASDATSSELYGTSTLTDDGVDPYATTYSEYLHSDTDGDDVWQAANVADCFDRAATVFGYPYTLADDLHVSEGSSSASVFKTYGSGVLFSISYQKDKSGFTGTIRNAASQTELAQLGALLLKSVSGDMTDTGFYQFLSGLSQTGSYTGNFEGYSATVTVTAADTTYTAEFVFQWIE